jgi:spore germination protein
MAIHPIHPDCKEIMEFFPDKILLEIPSYSYDFRLPYKSNNSSANRIGNQEAIQMAISKGSEIQYNKCAEAPFFHYFEDGTEHEVWFEDVRSLQAKYNMLDDLHLLGTEYCHVTKPFAQNWAYLSTQYNIQKYT